MKTHLLLTAAGTLLGLLLVAWVGPTTTGASFLVAVCVLIVNVMGSVFVLGRRRLRRAAGEKSPAEPHASDHQPEPGP